jgi:hypothetical protein
VHLEIADLREYVRRPGVGGYDRILLDVDNGPSFLARPENRALYEEEGLQALAQILRPGAKLAVWTAQREPALEARLRARFRDVKIQAVPRRLGGRETDDFLLLAMGPEILAPGREL